MERAAAAERARRHAGAVSHVDAPVGVRGRPRHEPRYRGGSPHGHQHRRAARFPAERPVVARPDAVDRRRGGVRGWLSPAPRGNGVPEGAPLAAMLLNIVVAFVPVTLFLLLLVL